MERRKKQAKINAMSVLLVNTNPYIADAEQAPSEVEYVKASALRVPSAVRVIQEQRGASRVEARAVHAKLKSQEAEPLRAVKRVVRHAPPPLHQ